MLKRLPLKVYMDFAHGNATKEEKALVRKVSAHNDKVNSVPRGASSDSVTA